jgi:hypothetical protein
MLAACDGHAAVVNTLIAQDADVDARDHVRIALECRIPGPIVFVLVVCHLHLYLLTLPDTVMMRLIRAFHSRTIAQH